MKYSHKKSHSSSVFNTKSTTSANATAYGVSQSLRQTLNSKSSMLNGHNEYKDTSLGGGGNNNTNLSFMSEHKLFRRNTSTKILPP
jgi:hypothetical protein